MLSADLKPWLLEVNSSPSLTWNTRDDYELKFGLIDDALSVLDMEKFFQSETQEQVGGFDLVYNGAVTQEQINTSNGANVIGARFRKSVPPNWLYKTYFGSRNNRREQLRTLAKSLAAKYAAAAPNSSNNIGGISTRNNNG